MEASRSLWRELTSLSLLESLVTLAGGASLIGFASTSERPAWAPGWVGLGLVVLGAAVAVLGGLGLVLWTVERVRRRRPNRSALEHLAAEGVALLAERTQT